MSPDKDILLGIDFGTGGCKVTAIDFTGVVAGEASVEYPTHFPRPGRAEQTPGDWYKALCGALKKLEEKGVSLRRVCALSLDGSTHNAVLLDGHTKTFFVLGLPHFCQRDQTSPSSNAASTAVSGSGSSSFTLIHFGSGMY